MQPVPPIECHPLQPFLPKGARVLMLGSFPPPRIRWCMDFFYPNPQNDMWRIMGLVFYGDKMRFVEEREKTAALKDKSQKPVALKDESQKPATLKEKRQKPTFRYEEIVSFCREKGIAIFDTAQAVRRLLGNAADEHLEIVEPTDITALLKEIPLCHNICCTGQKAADTLAETFGCKPPKVGEYIEVDFPLTQTLTDTKKPPIATSKIIATQETIRPLRFWRMPSSSRAYPLSLDKKAEYYRRMFETFMYFKIGGRS